MTGVPPTPPSWRLPTGVNTSLWHYSQSSRLAAEEDFFFARHPLFQVDRAALLARFEAPGPLIDLGAGAGRISICFAERGFPVTAVELSNAMLRVVGTKADALGVAVRRVRANLCDLRCFPDGSFDYATSMFSTLGMIRGAGARRRALAEAFRVLRPGGRLALHAHNLWLNLGDAQGRRWLAGQLGRYALRKADAGDRRMTYRGIPGMEVHLYRWPELRGELKGAGFRIDEVLSIDAVTARPIPAGWLFPGFRAGGWLVFASKPAGKGPSG